MFIHVAGCANLGLWVLRSTEYSIPLLTTSSLVCRLWEMKNWYVLFVHVPNWCTFMQAHMLATSLAIILLNLHVCMRV